MYAKIWIFHKNNILHNYFSKSVHGAMCKIGLISSSGYSDHQLINYIDTKAKNQNVFIEKN
jgi:hypothetical protein